MGPTEIEPESSAAEPPKAPAKARPKIFAGLLIPGDVGGKWFNQHKEEKIFIVVNLEDLVDELNIAYTAATGILNEAHKAVLTETTWKDEFAFDYKCSKMQLQTQAQREAKWPGKAATIIVALEIAAKQTGSNINVYERTAILQAHYFADGFDETRLGELTKYYENMSEDERKTKFGETAPPTFEEICLHKIGQSFSAGLLSEMAKGACAPAKLCHDLRSFINSEAFPPSLRVGETMSSGDPRARNFQLGTGNAAKSLRYSRGINLDDLLPT